MSARSTSCVVGCVNCGRVRCGRRYERGSIIVTSNHGFEQWGEILSDTMVAAALIDRIVNHATMIALQGKSYCLRLRAVDVAPAAQAPRFPDSARRCSPHPHVQGGSLMHSSAPETRCTSVPLDSCSSPRGNGARK